MYCILFIFYIISKTRVAIEFQNCHGGSPTENINCQVSNLGKRFSAQNHTANTAALTNRSLFSSLFLCQKKSKPHKNSKCH